MKGDFSMVKLYDGGVYLVNGREIVTDATASARRMWRSPSSARSTLKAM